MWHSRTSEIIEKINVHLSRLRILSWVLSLRQHTWLSSSWWTLLGRLLSNIVIYIIILVIHTFMCIYIHFVLLNSFRSIYCFSKNGTGIYIFAVTTNYKFFWKCVVCLKLCTNQCVCLCVCVCVQSVCARVTHKHPGGICVFISVVTACQPGSGRREIVRPSALPIIKE